MGTVSRIPSAARHSAVALFGFVLAVLVSQALQLETRYALAVIVGVLLLSVALCLLRNISDLLLYVMAFNLSFTSIEKSFLVTELTTFVVSAVSIGLLELCLIGLYALWFGRIFIAKTERLPAPTTLDWWVLAFWGVHVLSILNATSRELVIFEVIRLAKYASAYFYIAHNLRRRHLHWIVVAIFCGILLQTSLAVVQITTGSLMGIGRTKGASDQAYEQYLVDGFQDKRRAEGTTFDSHAFGLFLAMTVPLPLGLMMMQGLRPLYRVISGVVFALGVSGLITGFSRGGWVAFAGAFAVLSFCLVKGQYRRSWSRLIPYLGAGLLLTVVALLPFVPEMRRRIFEAPKELMTARFESIEMAIDMWKHSPLTGLGANNYYHTLERDFAIFEGDPYFIVVHNMFIFVMAEVGIIGVAVFIGFCCVVFATNWRAVRGGDPLLQSLASALSAGFAALIVEGMTDPIYITSVTYFLLWFQIGLGAGLYNMMRAGEANSAPRAQLVGHSPQQPGQPVTNR